MCSVTVDDQKSLLLKTSRLNGWIPDFKNPPTMLAKLNFCFLRLSAQLRDFVVRNLGSIMKLEPVIKSSFQGSFEWAIHGDV